MAWLYVSWIRFPTWLDFACLMTYRNSNPSITGTKVFAYIYLSFMTSFCACRKEQSLDSLSKSCCLIFYLFPEKNEWRFGGKKCLTFYNSAILTQLNGAYFFSKSIRFLQIWKYMDSYFCTRLPDNVKYIGKYQQH